MDANGTEANRTMHEAEGIRDSVLGGTLLGINVVIILLNALAVMVIMRFRTKNCIDILILGLAMTDLTKGLIPIPMSVTTYLTSWYMKKDTFACDFFGWIAFTTNSASMLILTMMAIERFVAIATPFSYRRLITKRRLETSVSVAVVFSCAISSLPVFKIGQMKPFNRGAYCHFDYTDIRSKSRTYAFFILVYGFAMTLVVLAAYSIVFYKIRDLIKRHKRFAISRSISSRSSSKRRKGRKGEINLKVEKMFSYLTLGLLVLFWVSWFPFLAVLLLNLADALPTAHDTVDLFAMRTAVINSMLNPIACASICKPYRRGFVYYYKKLLSYAGFARPDSDVFDPWRQKSREYTREQTAGDSFVQPESKMTHKMTDIPANTDSLIVNNSQKRFGGVYSDNEPIYSSQQTSMEEGSCCECKDSDDEINIDKCAGCNGSKALVLDSEEESNDSQDGVTEYNKCGNNVIHWKKNRVSREIDKENIVNGEEICFGERKILLRGRHDRRCIKTRPISKVKRYSMPVTNTNGEKNTKSLSLEGISRKHGKYRPWSVDINDRFRDWLRENAFESEVELIGYCDLDLKTEGDKNELERRNLIDRNMNDASEECANHKYQVENEQPNRTCKDVCKLIVKDENNWLAEKEIDKSSKTAKLQDRGQRRKNRLKFRSKSNPASSGSSTKEQSVKFASLRDDLNSSLLEMDLLAKGLLNFSNSKCLN